MAEHYDTEVARGAATVRDHWGHAAYLKFGPSTQPWFRICKRPTLGTMARWCPGKRTPDVVLGEGRTFNEAMATAMARAGG